MFCHDVKVFKGHFFTNFADVEVEEEEEKEDKPKTKSVEKTTWDWVLMNANKPIWTRK